MAQAPIYLIIPLQCLSKSRTPSGVELRLAALFWLSEPDAARKVEGVALLAQAWISDNVVLDARVTGPILFVHALWRRLER